MSVTEDGRFTGYASLFGRTDLGRDRVAPGAFGEALRRRGAAGIRMLFQHDPTRPIGVWEAVEEDGRGLRVTGRLAVASSAGSEIMALMRAGAVDGLSIGFRTVRAERDRRSNVRTITQADLWEISVVTFPMLPDARVAPIAPAGRPEPALRSGPILAGRLRTLTRQLNQRSS